MELQGQLVEAEGEWIEGPPVSLTELLEGMTDEEIETVWRYSGFDMNHVPTRARHPRPNERTRMLLGYLQPMTRGARREKARIFASLSPRQRQRVVLAVAFLSPRQRIVAVAALLRVLLGRVAGPARLKGRRGDRLRERAGHGGIPPMRGSPLGRLASLPLSGAPPALIRP